MGARTTDAVVAALPFKKTFKIDPDILGPNSAESVEVTGATDADVLQAIINNTPFPTRPNGQLPLGSVDLEASGGNQIAFAAGPAGSVSFDFSASFKTGVGVFDQPQDALDSLSLDAAPGLDLTVSGSAGDRYLLMLLGYKASGSFSGSQPIGAVGTVTFGAQASGDRLYAVLHRFPGATGADRVLGDTISSWHLPRHIGKPDNLKPGTWVVGQADGSIAIQVAAQVGYDFNFVRQANLLGMSRSLGAKIDAGLKATFGFDASGSYLVVLGRETDAPVVRLRLFKQRDQGLNFGLNLNVGITGQFDFPTTIDDLVKAVFGVHGQQVLKDLHLIEQWTDPTKDLGDTVARLINKTGLELLTRATGINAQQEFDKARQIVLNAFKQWDSLPERASAAIWKILDKAPSEAVADFKTFLSALANPDPQARGQALAQALAQVAFGDSPNGQWLEAIAEQGLLALSNQLDQVRKVASQTLNVLNGGVIKNLQDFINQHLDLEQIRKAVTDDDFAKVDEWLVKRMADFLDQELDLAGLKQIQTAIFNVLQKVQNIYARAIEALNNKYNLAFAATYQKNTSDTALLDVNFDLTKPEAAALLKDVVGNSHLDTLLVTPTPGVTLNQASLSHEIKRNSDVQIHMPFLDSKVQHVNDSLATLHVEHDSGRVLAYQLAASDTVTAQNRYQSQLSLLGKINVVNGQLQLDALAGSTLAYQSIQIKQNMSLVELESRTTPFLESMLAGVFAEPGSLDRFYMGLDQTISHATGNRNNNFGDIAVNLQVALPPSTLGAWFTPLNDSARKVATMRMSRSLQARLKELIPFFFFQDIKNLQPNETAAALLVWASIPVSTTITVENGEVQQFNTDKDVFWDPFDPEQRAAMAADGHTMKALIPMLLAAHDRLINAGDPRTAGFFIAQKTGFFHELATNNVGDGLLVKLLRTESVMVDGAAKALKDIQGALSTLATTPTMAILRLAKFGADLTDTFNKQLSLYSSVETMRTLNSMLLAEASRAIDPSAATETAAAMCGLTVLKQGHTFKLSDFLSGKLPPKAEVAVAQTLTNLGA